MMLIKIAHIAQSSKHTISCRKRTTFYETHLNANCLTQLNERIGHRAYDTNGGKNSETDYEESSLQRTNNYRTEIAS